MPQSTLRYAGFWPRLGAMLLDFVVWLPLVLLVLWGTAHSRAFYLAWQIAGEVLGLFTYVYMVGRFGGSPGKLIAGLRIVRLDGAPVGYGRAFLRNAPDFVLSVAYCAGMFVSVLGLSEQGYLAVRQQKAYSELFEHLGPAWLLWIKLAEQVWLWSEFIVLLTNKKRRALHDFLAGTVVIHKPAAAADPAPRPEAAMPAIETPNP